MTARWRPSTSKQKTQAAAVDDWENDEDEQQSQSTSSGSAEQGASGGQDESVEAWPSLLGGSTSARTQQVNGTADTGPWARTAPISNNTSTSGATSASPTPLILSASSGRTLPTSILPPSTSGLGSAPQILRRNPKMQNGRGSSANAEQPTQQRKTLAEREKEYEEARRRIFGDAADEGTSTPESSKGNLSRRKGKAGVAAGGPHTPGGSNSSSRSSTPKGQGRTSPKSRQSTSTAAQTSNNPPP